MTELYTKKDPPVTSEVIRCSGAVDKMALNLRHQLHSVIVKNL